MSVSLTERCWLASAAVMTCSAALASALPPAEATSSVSVFAAGLITSAALTDSSRIRRRAAAGLLAAVACSGADGIRLSLVTSGPDSGAGATTASGIRCGVGAWKAPA